MRRYLTALAVLVMASVATPSFATFPYPSGGSDPYDYTRLHITNGSCAGVPSGQPKPAGSDLPPGFDCRNSTKLTDYAAQLGDLDFDPSVANNPQELFGVKGSGTNRAWEVTTGRPDTVIAVMDSGIQWNTPDLVNKVHLNFGELPIPCHAGPCTTSMSTNWKAYDANQDGVFNIVDYEAITGVGPRDPRLVPQNGSYLTGQDLIRRFSNAIDDDGNGYVDDISGWDFYQRDNDPSDDVTYGHGTGEAKDSSAEIGRAVTQCPNCMFMPLRVGDSFIAESDRWAQGVVYAVDNGVSVIQEALGTLNHTSFSQAAVDYAYKHGVLVVASEADEEAGHHNYPAALNHTMVVNSVTHYASQSGAPLQGPFTYLAFNGCTNFGGYTWVTVPSNSCSSDATGQAAGMAGLLYSAARNAMQTGAIAPDASGRPLAAEEAKQLFRAAADDIDLSTPKPPFGPPDNTFTTLPASQRYVMPAGWDQITGWGKINANKLVRLIATGQIPPQADITSPSWWAPLPTAGTFDVVGRVAAPRVGTYTYDVQYAPGVQPPRWPLSETWKTVTTASGTLPTSGVLATLDLAQIRAAMDAAPPAYTPADDPTSGDLPEKDAFRVRVVVHAPGAPDAIEQRQYFSHADADLLPGFPRNLGADGAGSGAFADLNADGKNELVLADGNGYVHAFEASGGELAGWPVHTDALPLPATGSNAFTNGDLSSSVYAPMLLGSPAIADLDHDGTLEVSMPDSEGALYVWHASGTRAAGFPVHDNPAYSHVPGCQEPLTAPNCDEFSAHPVRDHINTVDRAFVAAPAVGDIDPSYDGLELVLGSEDGHVYAFHADGTSVPGWPVLSRDPAKVVSVDPVSHRVAFKSGSNVKYGKQVVAGVSLGDVNGDGIPEIAVNVNEEYLDTPNWSFRDPALGALAPVAPSALGSGNTRIYLLWHDGTNHPGTAKVANLGDNAYVAGWPVPIAMIKTELLPDVGSGSDGPPVFATIGGKRVIATASIGTPPYLLNPDGTSYYGADPAGRYLTMASSQSEFKSSATDGPSLASLGGGVFGKLGGPGSPAVFAMGSTGLKRLLDVVLPDQQLGAEDHLGAWDPRTGTYEPGFPAQMNDLMFFNTPAIADVDGDGRAEILQGSAMYDLRAYSLGGLAPASWPKFTGGWVVSTPSTGDFDGDGMLDVAIMTREGNLFVWRTKGSSSQPLEWPKYQHDLKNTGDYGSE